MKKTIIALLAISGIVLGATTATIDTSDSNLQSYFNFATSNEQTAGTVSGWGELLNWNSIGQYGTAGVNGATSQNMYTSSGLGINMKADGGFTISFDINNVTKTGTLLTVLTSSPSAGSPSEVWRCLKADITKDETTGNYSFSSTIGSKTVTTDLGSELDWTTITLVGLTNPGEQNSDYTMDFSVYVNGDYKTGFAKFGAWNFIVEDLSKIQFGYWGTSSNSAHMDMDNVLIYDRAFSAAEVKSLVVPEPTTATLSLLALAGLAARRRRR